MGFHDPDSLHSLQGKGSLGLAVFAIPDQIPATIEVSEMERTDGAGFPLLRIDLSILEPEGAAFQHGSRDLLKQSDIGGNNPGVFHRERFVEVRPPKGHFSLEGSRESLEAIPQGCFEGGALERFDCLPGEEEGDDVLDAVAHQRKLMNGSFVEVAMFLAIVLERQSEIVLHEGDVPLDRFLGDLDLLGELTAIRKSTALDGIMDRKDSFEGATGVPGSSGTLLGWGTGSF